MASSISAPLAGWGSGVKTLVTVIVAVAGLFLGIRDLPYVASAAGRCEIGQQPIILAGEAPTLTVQLECALAQPSTPAPAPAQPSSAPAPADPGPVPSVPADELTPGPLPAGASFPAGYPNVACADGKSYVDENGDNQWIVDPEDPQNSPCNQG